jgi:hypothetical protein
VWLNRHLLDNFQTKSMQTGIGLWMISEQSQASHAEVAEDLPADADFPAINRYRSRSD